MDDDTMHLLLALLRIASALVGTRPRPPRKKGRHEA